MLEQLKGVFDVAKQRIDYYEDIIVKIENKPQLILTDLYIEDTPNNLLAFLVNNLEENSLVNFQSYLYRKLIPYLKSNINIDGLGFDFSIKDYPSPLTILQNDVPIGDIYIYQRLFVLRGNDKRDNLILKVNKLNDELRELELRNEELSVTKINPLALGGSNPLKLADIALRKKTYMKNINNDINNISEEIFRIQRELSSINIAIEKARQDFIEAEYSQERVSRKFKSVYGYNIIEDVKELQNQKVHTTQE